MSENQITIERVRVLNGHTGKDTAYLVEDYPYGRTLRCKRRTWIETATQGRYKGMQRFVYQTTNPKCPTEIWNKPHPSSYDVFMVMYLDEQEHVHYWNVGLGVTPAGDARMRLMGLYDQLTDNDRARYDALLARSQRYVRPWHEWEETTHALACHIRETGTDPEVTNGFWEGPISRHYLADDAAPYIVTARQRATTASSAVLDAG